MTSTRRTLLLAATLTTLGLACDRARPVTEEAGGSSPLESCTSCHGDATRPEPNPLLQAAPPRGASGQDGGAHLAHLHAGPYSGAIACAECHVVPTGLAHVNGAVDLTFGALASSGGRLTPAFSGGSCSSVYCHGATLQGGTATAPTWTGGPLACGACHGAPPPSHASTATHCSGCHPGTVAADDATILVANGLHVNGTVEASGGHLPGWGDPAQHGPAAKRDLASCRTCHGEDYAGGASGVSCNACHGGTAWQANCTFCHGTRVASYTAADLSKAAPPLGSQGETSTADRAVGAHAVHLSGGPLAGPVACTDCHAALPTDLSHVDGAAQLAFGAGATRGGAQPSWNGTGCSATYCHGAFPNGAQGAPAWTSGAGLGCDACHRPQSGSSTSSYTNLHYKHVFEKRLACSSCHGAGYGATTVNAATHVDGAKQVVFVGGGTYSAGTCSGIACHGSERW